VTKSTRNWFIDAPIVCALVPLICLPAMEWLAVAPYGSEGVLWFEVPFVLPTLVAIYAFFSELVRLAVRRRKPNSILVAVCAATYLVALLFAVSLGNSVRMSAFHRAAERSKPLIGTIRAFEEKHGHPPESPHALVPEYQPSVPTTGMGANPDYGYSTNEVRGNSWMLSVSASRGLSFDMFLYFPRTNYSDLGSSPKVKRVGDWAYVRED